MIAAGAIPAADIRVGSQQALAVYAGEDLVWEADFMSQPCLTFISESVFSLGINFPDHWWDGELQYSTDGRNWTIWDGLTTLTAVDNGSAYILMLRGIGNTVITAGMQTYGRWIITGADVCCYGNIETLLDYATVENGGHPTVGAGCFAGMFYNCAALITAPEIGCISLPTQCCEAMFYGCVNLVTLPRLYATYFGASNSCQSMFRGCSKIKLSETQTAEYQTPYRLPSKGTGTSGSDTTGLKWMFDGTGGTFTGEPALNITYYTSNAPAYAQKPSEFAFEITDETLEVTLNYIQASANDVEIDWGDNSTPTKSAVAGATSQTHTYASAGTYTVLFTAAVGSVWSPGGEGGSSLPMFVSQTWAASSPYSYILKSTKLNESVTTIPAYGLGFERAMTYFSASPALASIGASGLAVCRSLSAIDGINNVTEFGDYALAENDALLSFVVPFGTTVIPSQLLFNTDLVTLSIPVTVTQIDDSAINDPHGTLTDVYYGGTQEQWAQISVGTDNAGLNTATIHYNSV